MIFTHELDGDWLQRAHSLVNLAVKGGHGVIYVDNFSAATGVEDESGVELGKAADLLRRAARKAGLAVWVNHHHKKGHAKARDKSRGCPIFCV